MVTVYFKMVKLLQQFVAFNFTSETVVPIQYQHFNLPKEKEFEICEGGISSQMKRLTVRPSDRRGAWPTYAGVLDAARRNIAHTTTTILHWQC